MCAFDTVEAIVSVLHLQLYELLIPWYHSQLSIYSFHWLIQIGRISLILLGTSLWNSAEGHSIYLYICHCINYSYSETKNFTSTHISQTFFWSQHFYCLPSFSSFAPRNCYPVPLKIAPPWTQCQPIGRLLVVFSPLVAEIQKELSSLSRGGRFLKANKHVWSITFYFHSTDIDLAPSIGQIWFSLVWFLPSFLSLPFPFFFFFLSQIYVVGMGTISYQTQLAKAL